MQVHEQNLQGPRKHLHVRNASFEDAGKEHEVVVLYPDHVPGPVHLKDGLRKSVVGCLVRSPLLLQRLRLAQLALCVQGDVVEQLPQHAVAEAVVVQVHLQSVDGEVRHEQEADAAWASSDVPEDIHT